MKTIDTLVKDIYTLLAGEIKIEEELVTRFTHRLVEKLVDRLTSERRKPGLSMSNFGRPCDRQLWYKVNKPEEEEKLPPQTRFKFLYGDILEEFIIFLAEVAGHRVEGHQASLEVAGVPGSRDVLIDGTLVDAKSTSTRSFEKFRDGTIAKSDDFGYLSQLNMYRQGGKDDPLQIDKESAAFLAIDKQHGHICLDKHKLNDVDYLPIAEKKRAMLADPVPPPRGFSAEEDGKSGNMKLGVSCSYCPHKKTCWPGLRTFLYSSGPRFLTRVVRLPDVPEVHNNK